MGRKCNVESCLSDSMRPEDTGVTFHKVPMHPDIRPKWMSLCKIPDDKKDVKVIYICSRHFLRADFCNFKGKKYMLKQGVLPSVFPWSKTKSDNKKSEGKKVVPPKNDTTTAIASTTSSEPAVTDRDNANVESTLVKQEPKVVENPEINLKESPENIQDLLEIKQEMLETAPDNSLKINENNFSSQAQSTIEQKVKTVQTSFGALHFSINARIEALDFNEVWLPARVVEIDYEENEVLIHFEKYSNKYDEWICMDSARLRPLQENIIKPPEVESYAVGERCMAFWSDARKFPATVQRIIDKDTFEVLFDDGYVKILKTHRMVKCNSKTMQSSPLFDPVRGSKQDRRDKKRKLNVAALFKKKPRTELEEHESWLPSWIDGKPVGIDATIETSDGFRKSVIVADPRLPSGWVKHLARRTSGASAGKWDCIIVSPEGRRFRTRSDIRAFLEDKTDIKYSDAIFDFSLSKRSRRSVNLSETPRKSSAEVKVVPPPEIPAVQIKEEEVEENANLLKIPIVDNAFQCPIEGCKKNFRKENLAQMHVKHYHPEYTKFLDSTPNVADLAYARTVGEALDKSPSQQQKTTPKPVQKFVTQKVATPKVQSPIVDEQKPQITPLQKAKDSEIIKLLNSKPFDSITKNEEKISALPPGLPPSMYPDIKLKDLLSKSEGIPKRDDLNIRNLISSTARPTGIKTLLPVIRNPPENKPENVLQDIESAIKTHAVQKPILHKEKGTKRKRVVSEIIEQKPRETPEIQEPAPPQSNIIIEGGEVIKIVQMKREEIINCTCGITEEDGLMIQCELCLCWQHAYCNNIERENQVPEKYICYICQNPARQRSSRKYYHDQDWLKSGTLPTGSYHAKDEELLAKRFEKLKKSHDISGGLVELKDYMHTLKVKIKIAEAKNHPKLYQWSKPWEKLPLPEKMNAEITLQQSSIQNQSADTKLDPISKSEPQSDSMLMSILKSGKEEQKLKDLGDLQKLDINTLIENNLDPPIQSNIPQPEAAIDTADCRLNLIEHIAHSQSLVEERLNDFEEQINALDVGFTQEEDDENYPRMRQTLQMLLRDLSTLKEFSQVTTL